MKGAAAARDDGAQRGGELHRRLMQQMQAGMPILLRLSESGKQEDLKMCTLSVSRDLMYLRWKDHDQDGPMQQVALSSISDVSEAPTQSDKFRVLLVNIDKGKRRLELICVSSEDLALWKDGLSFLASAAARSLSEQASSSPSGNAGKVPPSPCGNSAGEVAQLRQKLAQQEELIAELKQENSTLSQAVTRKDATIAALLQDAKTKKLEAERCSKTASTSRESDDHLRDRENAMLRQKNEKLRKALKMKEKQVGELLSTLGRVMKDTGAESAYEELEEDDGKDSDNEPPAAPAVAFHARSATPAPGNLQDDDDDDGNDDDPEAVQNEIQQITSEFQRLVQAVQELQQGSDERGTEAAIPAAQAVPPPPLPRPVAPSGDPPAMPRGGWSFAPPARSTQVAAATSVSSTTPVPAASPALDFSAIGLAPTPQRKSTASLEALAKEMKMFEEKKRLVEQLARSLDPTSENDPDEDDDDDEADGFPLR